MYHRTKTYIAGDWDNDIDAINQLITWNDSDYYSTLGFVNVHDFIQAKDTSLYCSIKNSLSKRMFMCKTFILIVGEHTNKTLKGNCNICHRDSHCYLSHHKDYRSYIKYECDLAILHNLKIVVLYNSNTINKNLCPNSLRYVGTHVAMKINNKFSYSKVRDAIV